MFHLYLFQGNSALAIDELNCIKAEFLQSANYQAPLTAEYVLSPDFQGRLPTVWLDNSEKTISLGTNQTWSN